MRHLVLLATLALPLTTPAVVATTSKIDPGDSDLAYSFVGMMSGCSAVAIGPHSVLTAGHVGAGDFWLGSDVYHMTSTEVAPDWKKNDVDLRLVTVAETLPGWYTIADSVKKGATVTMVGYGSAGVVNSIGSGYVLSTPAGARHAGTNTISSKETTSGEGPTLRAMLDGAGEAALTSGDSGGGWFVNGKLVGISAFTFTTKNKPSYGWSKNAYFGSAAIDLTNGTMNGWLDDLIADDLNDTIDSPALSRDFEIQATPEPAGFVALGLGVGMILKRKRSRP